MIRYPYIPTRRAALFLLLLAAQPVTAQVGYISVHVKALNEESSPGFRYTVTGGPTAVTSFTLNDLPSNLRCSDLGGSHGPGGSGELWVIAGAKANAGANGMLFFRRPGGAVWISTGDSASAVDGAGADQCVYTTAAGYVVSYEEGHRDTLYIPGHHGGHRAVDVGNNASLSPGTGATVIADDRGHLLAYRGAYASGSDTWVDASVVNPAIPAGLLHVDVNPINNNVLFSVTGQKFYQLSASGSVTYLGAPGSHPASNPDVAYDDLGGIYCLAQSGVTGGDGVYKWRGGESWKGDSTSRNVEHVTGGATGELWGVNGMPTDESGKSEVFSRSMDTTGFWYDNEWINPSGSDAIFLPVSPGNYTITQSMADQWSCQRITLYDPLSASTASVQGGSAVLHVQAGEVVTVDFQDGLVAPAVIPQVCKYAIQQDFGTGSATCGGPLTGLTDYHYLGATFVQDGFYTLAKTTGTAWQNHNLVDHTTGHGYFMIVNASFAQDEFFRERVTGLVPGLHYTLSAYIADISPQTPLRPNVLFGISDASTGALLGSLSTGDIHNTAWQQYSFTFVATTTTADIFLSNNGIGGTGNDLALDDIAFSPIADPVSPIAHAGPDTLCTGSLLSLSDATASGLWTSLDPGVASVSGAGTLTALGAGQARIAFTVTNKIGCVSADTAVLTVQPHGTPADITVNQPSTCTGDTVVLHASSAAVTAPRFSWYVDSALTHLVDTGAVFRTPALTSTTTYFVGVSGSNTCASLPWEGARTVVTVYPYPVVPALTGTATVCAGSGTLLGDATAGGAWTVTPDSVAGSDSTGWVTGKQAGSAQVTYTVTNPGGCSTSAVLPFSVKALPPIDSITGAHPVCPGDTLLLEDAVAGGAWSSTNAGIAPVDQEGHTVGVSPGTASIRYTVTGANGCAAQASAPLAVQAAPSTPSIQTGDTTTVCGGRPVALYASAAGAYSYQWYLDGSPIPADTVPIVSTTVAGNFKVVALTSAGCASPSSAPLEVSSRCEIDNLSDLSIRKQVSPGPYSLQNPVTYSLSVVNLGPTEARQVVVTDTLPPGLGEPVNYGGPLPSYNAAGRILTWAIPVLAPGDSVLLTFDIPLEILDVISNTAHVTSAVEDPNMANNQSTATIWEDAGLFIPNAVSPNGDGKNDRFLIVGLERYPGSALSVFNRWGNEVYHSSNYQNDWDGHELSDGTYYYVLILNAPEGKQARKGWVLILHK